MIVRYFHIRPAMPNEHNGGITVKVTGFPDRFGQVEVQYAVCSKQDTYVKQIGRDMASKASIKIVPLRYLPRELSRLDQANKIKSFSSFEYSIPYFLPKE